MFEEHECKQVEQPVRTERHEERVERGAADGDRSCFGQRYRYVHFATQLHTRVLLLHMFPYVHLHRPTSVQFSYAQYSSYRYAAGLHLLFSPTLLTPQSISIHLELGSPFANTQFASEEMLSKCNPKFRFTKHPEYHN